MLYAVIEVNARPQSFGPMIKLFRNVTCLFGCCLMSVSMVALSSGQMLTVAGILICSTSHTGSRDYNIGECKSWLPGFYFTPVLLPAAGMLSTTLSQTIEARCSDGSVVVRLRLSLDRWMPPTDFSPWFRNGSG